MILKTIQTFYPMKLNDKNMQIERCIEQTESIFSPVLMAMYIKSKGMGKSEATQIVDLLKNSYRQSLKSSTWLGDSVQRAENKLDQMSIKIGYPTSIQNDTWLDLGNNVFHIQIIKGRAIPYSRDCVLKIEQE